MLRTKKRWQQLLSVATLVGMGCAGAQAGTAFYDFNTDPSAELNFVGSLGAGAFWRDTGGVDNSGYVALFDAVNSQYAAVLIPDFDQGLVVKGFTFEVDLRVGNAVGNGGRPADGFSISYARVNDPVVVDLAQEPPVNNQNSFHLGGAPESGTSTGLSICFDTWSGNTQPDGGADLEGIMVKVDGTVLNVNGARGIAMATRNGSCTDPTSMQTGPYDEATNGDPSGLCWAHLKVEVNDLGELTVTWKGTVIANKLATGFAPGAGRIVFAGRTGGANENTHIDNLRITTIPSDTAVIGAPKGLPTGFTMDISDSGPSVFDANAAGAIVSLKLDGTAVTATSAKTGGLTTLTYNNPATPLVPGSTHAVSVSIKDVRGVAITKDFTFTAIGYTTLDPAWAATGVDKTKPGFTLRVGQVDMVNSAGTSVASDVNTGVTIASAERILHGDLGPNTADLTLFTGAGGTYAEPNVINYNGASGDIGAYKDDGTVAGGTIAPNLPGLPGTAGREGGLDDVAMDIVTYIEFPKQGSYRLIFNSDDGFRTMVYANPLEQLNSSIVSVADVGRGASDSIDWVYVGTPGIYPFRTIWTQGGGGVNMEWAAINADGVRALINDSTTPGALKAYRVNSGAEPAAVSYIDPPRATGRAVLPTEPIVVEITDGASAVTAIKLTLNGKEVTPTITKTGKVSKVKYTPVPILPEGNNTLVVSFTDGAKTYSGTNTFSATQGVTIPESMALNAADVDKTKEGFIIKTYQVAITNEGATGANRTPNSTWAGEVFVHSLWGWPNRADLTAFTGPGNSYVESATINYNGPTGGNSGIINDDVGMPGIVTNDNLPEAGIGDYALEIRTVLDLQPGTYNMSVNSDDGFRLIVGDGKEAFTFPVVAGEYNGGRGNTTGFDFTRFSVRVTKAGLYPFRLVFEEGGGGNNVEWFVFSQPWAAPGVGMAAVGDSANGAPKAYQYPISSTGPTYVKSFSPARSLSNPILPAGTRPDSAASIGHAGPDATVGAVLVDGSTPVVAASVALKVNGVAVTPTVTKTGSQTTVSYKPAGGFAMGSTNSVDLSFTDRTVSWQFVVGLPATPTFWIEAADFDFNGGQTKPEASVMPYAGGAYAGLGAVAGTDYDGPFESSNPYYRYPNSLRVPVSIANDLDRGGGEVVVDYRIGWMGGNHWFNYTRTFPAGNYNVYAALSHADGPTSGTRIGGALEEVNGGVATVLGAFDAPATGGWGNSALVPLKDAASTNSIVSLNLSGTKTLRYHDRNGDYEYLLFVPATGTVDKPKFSGITKNADGTVTITWTGGGTLQAGAAVSGPWQDVTGATSPYTFTPSAAQLFGRLRQ